MNLYKKICTTAVLVYILAIPSSVVAASKMDLGVTLGTYGIGAKVGFTNNFAAELRYALEPDVHNTSFRGCYLFLQNKNLSPFAGVEYGLIDFVAEDITGTGNMMNAFIGSELRLKPWLALNIDLAYSYVTLTSGDYSVAGPEWLFNAGIVFYLKTN
ncbi:MAG: hypothetical protein WC955_02285 [Elusimicrobiota bacterium]